MVILHKNSHLLSHLVSSHQCKQYLNCRGDAGGRVPPLRFSVPPSRFRRPPIESGVQDDQTKNSQPGLKDPTNFLPKMVANCGEDLFFGLHLILWRKHCNFWRRPFFSFYGLHLILRRKHGNFRRRPFSCFSSSFNFGDGNTSFPQKLVKAAKLSPPPPPPPQAKFYNLSTECKP